MTDAAEAAEAIGRLGQDLAPRLRATGATRATTWTRRRPGCSRRFPVRRGVTVGRLTVVAGLPAATVAGVLGRLELTGLAEREGQGWRQGAAARRGATGDPAQGRLAPPGAARGRCACSGRPRAPA